MIKLISIGYEVPGMSSDQIPFSSKNSLMDGDFVIFSPENPGGYEDTFQGKNSYTEHGSFQFKDDSAHWRRELKSFLESGKTVFLFLKAKDTFFLKTGTKEHKPKLTINHVSEHNNYEFLPITIGQITTSKGKNIEFISNPIFSTFYSTFKERLEYESYLENVITTKIIFTGKDKTKILGCIHKVGTGNLVILPCLNYSMDKFTNSKTNKNGETELVWTPEAMEFGSKLFSSLSSINKSLIEEFEKSPVPTWVENKEYCSNLEISIENEINKNNDSIKNIENKNSKLSKELIEEKALKDLLFEQGKPLEKAVISALKLLGYKAEGYNDGTLELDQIITSPEGFRYIGECEGKDNKDIDITKFRQLLESLNADFDREDVQEKALGILFGNAQRTLEPKNRTLDFTEKCKIGAKREGIALIKTSDLYKVVTYLKGNNDEVYKIKCRESIQKQLGRLVKFPKIPISERTI